ncbi:MAG TPA: prepilin-type N-terminal cleavage/methylation domain-containing protein [Luteimonas sp.]|nr:prepilin-type N-terminal cleavage/methylation domain-containing protein [Luteimonas sp.]
MIRLKSTGYRSRGFSLLEVMIAVVVLATGLLALAALQGSLTRSSAEAKVRGRVAAMLSARMDELRSVGYGNAALNTGTVTTPITLGTIDPCDGDATDWLDCTRTQAGLGSLDVTQVTHIWSSIAGASNFTEDRVPAADEPEFKRVSLTASWTDATGGNHQLASVSDMSFLGLSASLIPPPDDEASGGGGPTVRTTNPATAGVIPIALGNGESSAASNPTPELVGSQSNQKIVGTKFNVLTYTPSGNAAIIQRRFENEVIKCSCQYGAGSTLPAIYQTAQWPAIWTGERYDLYKPNPVAPAPGQALSSGRKSGVEQSPLCQECCRDHHDTSTAGVAKFDPERTIATGETTGREKYYLTNQNALQITPNTTNFDYVNACRVIRVDGFWRTASDMYSRQFGLLETESRVEGGVTKQAKTGLPTTAATVAYTTFVKNYLKQYDGTVATAPTGAQALFDGTTGINVPSLVTIDAPNTTDYRYLHGRGLYVDYLEAKARTKLVDVLADTGAQGRCPTGSNIEDCVLPYLPFTSANLTEIATWIASVPTVLVVNSGNLLATDPSQPSGSRTYGRLSGTSNNTATVRQSNSGVAINTVLTTLDGVDPTDNTTVNDAQPFQVSGSLGTGDDFFVRISGGGLNPFVFYTVPILGADSGECLKPAGSPHDCGTNSTLPSSGSISLSHYWSEAPVSTSTTTTLGSIQCTYNGSPVTVQTNGQNANIDVPAFHNYYVSAASIGATPGLLPYTVVGDGLKTETTSVSFALIPNGSTAQVTLSEQSGSPILATLVSCTATQQGNNYYFGVGTWNQSW